MEANPDLKMIGKADDVGEMFRQQENCIYLKSYKFK
jgi:hypothetical protein